MLADAAPGTDPLALIIGGGAACIATLSMLVWTLLLARVSRIERDTKDTAGHLSGQDGMTVRMARLEEAARRHDLEIGALKAGTLTRELFEFKTEEQNRRLEAIDRKVENVDGAVRRMPTPFPPRKL